MLLCQSGLVTLVCSSGMKRFHLQQDSYSELVPFL
jgi:hypothetical protein